MSKTIRQTVVLAASPKQVFSALIDEKKHARFTGSPASISRKPGGRFACYGGYISGYNLDIVAGKRIVQAWRDKDWPSGYYSIVTFALSRKSGGRTRLAFTHAGVPASNVKAMTQGWKDFYWKPLKGYVER